MYIEWYFSNTLDYVNIKCLLTSSADDKDAFSCFKVSTRLLYCSSDRTVSSILQQYNVNNKYKTFSCMYVYIWYIVSLENRTYDSTPYVYVFVSTELHVCSVRDYRYDYSVQNLRIWSWRYLRNRHVTFFLLLIKDCRVMFIN